MKPGAFFICGTDTEVGKSLVTAGLLKSLSRAGAVAGVVKAVQTGPELHDQNIYARACPGAAAQTLLHFQCPASPHLAAAAENAVIDLGRLAEEIERAVAGQGLTLIEGSGGLCSPLTDEATFLDLMIRLGYPVVLVIKNSLGAINQALLSVSALKNSGLAVRGLIFTRVSPAQAGEGLIQADNVKTIAHRTGLSVLADLPFLPALAGGRGSPPAWAELADHLAAAALELSNDRAAESAGHSREITAFDREHLWHPYAPVVNPPQVWPVARGAGNYLILPDGRRLLDGMASWWCAIHGHGRPELAAALREQAAVLPHAMFGGLTHEPAVRLGQALLKMAPPGLDKIFYCDSGSVAVEVALKMALQYWQGRGRPNKVKFIAPLGGYHGDTLGAMSVCDPVGGMHALFKNHLPQQIFVPRPAAPFGEAFNPDSTLELERAAARHHGQCAGLILEPIVQGAGGMWMYHPDYLRAAARICREHDLLLIFDEVATGFGRTGRLFAADWAGLTPDIMCLGKALTGGTLTLAATLATRTVAEGLSRGGGVLRHGPTFMANPLACRVALASLELLSGSPWSERVAALEQELRLGLAGCAASPAVAGVRVLGAIGVVEMKQPVNQGRLQKFLVEDCGVWLRPFGRLIYTMPPFTVTRPEARRLTGAISRAVEEGWA